ncbi:MAG: DUF4399 domain-containing protein [Rhodothermales bacterium]
MLRHSLSAIVLIAGLAACTPAEEPAAPASDQAAAPAPAPGPTPSAEGAMSYIISPEDGTVVSGPVTVRFGLKGMGVAPAGVQVPNTGHHHLMVDVADMPDLSAPLPADANHIHFGAGQTETVLDLPPGEHTLQLILGDFAHTPHDPPVVSERVTITVQ